MYFQSKRFIFDKMKYEQISLLKDLKKLHIIKCTREILQVRSAVFYVYSLLHLLRQEKGHGQRNN